MIQLFLVFAIILENISFPFLDFIKDFSNYVGNFIFKTLGLENLVGNFLKSLDQITKNILYIFLIILAIIVFIWLIKNIFIVIAIAIILAIILYVLFTYF
ncbi:MAG: hypothetical protein QW197_00635 [Candidatus Aenigmatarchaeota archaeon]